MAVVGGGCENAAPATAFAKTICSICFEDLKPIVEDLQSISICGHVFHELCLQQWFEYCVNGKKKNCPVCKQNCSNATVSRLYFQSIGDPNDQTATQKPSISEENPGELRYEINRLEGKVSRLSSALDQQQKRFEASSAEVLVLKELLKEEEALKKAALNQNVATQRLIQMKSEELDRSTLECMRLQNRNMALAKELAALKLVSDLDLDEGEVLKLACLGNEVNSKETVDVLKKSLVIRNKSYKELMKKCNMIGRGEARSLAELKKAQEKIKKLKERVQVLESVVEGRDNEVLRTLRPSGAATSSMNTPNDSFQKHIKTGGRSYQDQNREPSLPETDLAVDQGLDDYSSCLRKKRRLHSMGSADRVGTVLETVARNFFPDSQKKGPFSINEDKNTRLASEPALHHGHFKPSSESGVELRECNSRIEDQESDTHILRQGHKDKLSGAYGDTQSETVKRAAIFDDDVIVIDDIPLSQPFVKVIEETPSPVVSHPGDRSFAAHLGKWCKKGHNKGLQGSNASSGDLIAVGADGRGGTVKFLKSLNQPSLNNRETQPSTKTNQNGARSSSSLKSYGCRQIEQFFGKASQPKKL